MSNYIVQNQINLPLQKIIDQLNQFEYILSWEDKTESIWITQEQEIFIELSSELTKNNFVLQKVYLSKINSKTLDINLGYLSRFDSNSIVLAVPLQNGCIFTHKKDNITQMYECSQGKIYLINDIINSYAVCEPLNDDICFILAMVCKQN